MESHFHVEAAPFGARSPLSFHRESPEWWIIASVVLGGVFAFTGRDAAVAARKRPNDHLIAIDREGILWPSFGFLLRASRTNWSDSFRTS